MRALVVEDEDTLREQIEATLRDHEFAIDSAADGDEGLYLATTMPIDIAIIDLGLPGIDGLSLIRKLRSEQCTYPVLILTARDSWQDKVEGLEAGADDYLAKPFHLEELMARLRALLRRSGGWSESQLRFGRLLIDTRTQQVSVDNVLVELTAYEYRVISYLGTHAGSVISKAKLLDHLYEEENSPDPNVVKVFIRRLRQKLDKDKSLNPIETLRGRGYRLALAREGDTNASETSASDAGNPKEQAEHDQ